VQVDPIKPALKAPGTKRLKLIYDGPLSNFAFNFNLRRYNERLALYGLIFTIVSVLITILTSVQNGGVMHGLFSAIVQWVAGKNDWLQWIVNLR